MLSYRRRGDTMRFNTHNRTPKIETKKAIKIILAVEYGLAVVLFLFAAVACSIFVGNLMPAVLILFPFFLLAMLLIVPQKDMNKAYVEIVDNVVTVVDYYLGIKKEKTFSVKDIDSAEILMGYSIRVRGYRYSNAGVTYIVFRDYRGKYMFKVICVPETKVFFEDFLKQ